MKPNLKSLLLATALGVATLLATSVLASADDRSPVDDTNGREPPGAVQTEKTPFSTIKTPGGNTLQFYDLSDGKGAVAFGVRESTPAGKASVLDRPELRDSDSVLEVFNALSKPGDAIPAQIASRLGTSAKLGVQGWLSSQTPAQASTNWCSSSTFQDHFDDDFAGWSRLVRLQERPIDHPSRWDSYTEHFGLPGDGVDAYRYKASVYDVEKFHTHVVTCVLDNHPDVCTNYGNCRYHVGPEIVIRYVSPNGVYGTVKNVDIPLGGQGSGSEEGWNFYGASNYDWFTEVRLAQRYDKFNIGLAWQNTN